jgi:hypothetical protein
MNIQRSTLACAAALATSMSATYAGPCSPDITRVQEVIDARIHAKARAMSAPESKAAKMHRQPTPSSIAAAEATVGQASSEQFNAVTAAMARAREADGGIIAQGRDAFQPHVAAALERPLVVLLEQDGADQTRDGVLVAALRGRASRAALLSSYTTTWGTTLTGGPFQSCTTASWIVVMAGAFRSDFGPNDPALESKLGQRCCRLTP